MLYLVTGANGAGKTLNTLKWIRERSVKESRPVCHNGRFEPVEDGELSSWKFIDIKNWQDEPDGTIFLVDECHNDFPLRAPSSAPPDYVKMLAEHRRRGFDFYLVTQHPQNIDSFVRRLIGSPGWHRHLKRNFGGDLVSCLEWPSVNPNCEKEGSGKTGTVTMVPFPKEVFGWYKSASIHTGKKKIPWRVWLLFLCAVIAPLLLYFAFSAVSAKAKKPQETAQVTAPASSAPSPAGVPASPASSPVQTVEDYLKARMPRVPAFAHTAPVYDDVTKPVHAPYPAACIQSATRCRCYSQQGTILRIDDSVCGRIVADGFFVDWELKQPQHAALPPPRPIAASTPALELPSPPVLVAAAPAQPQLNPSSITAQPKPLGYLEALRLRNSQVRSAFEK